MDLVMAAHAQAAAMAQLYAANAAALAANAAGQQAGGGSHHQAGAGGPMHTGGQQGGIPMLSGTPVLGSAFIQGPPGIPQPPPPPPIRS